MTSQASSSFGMKTQLAYSIYPVLNVPLNERTLRPRKKVYRVFSVERKIHLIYLRVHLWPIKNYFCSEIFLLNFFRKTKATTSKQTDKNKNKQKATKNRLFEGTLRQGKSKNPVEFSIQNSHVPLTSLD